MRADRQLAIVPTTLAGVGRNALQRPAALRYQLIRDMWSVTKRFAAQDIETIKLASLPAVQDCIVQSYIDDGNRAVLAALCSVAKAATFFEIGTNRGRTAWTVARNNPTCHVYTLDLPNRSAVQDVKFDLNASDRDFFAREWDRGEAYRGTEEETRITTLEGDSATFDFGPYEGKMDLVFVDGAHSLAYVENDSRHAFKLLHEGGMIAWDDYPAIPGVYAYLNRLARESTQPLYHISGTRLVILGLEPYVDRAGVQAGPRQYVA